MGNWFFPSRGFGETEGLRHYMLSSRIERSARNRIEAIKLHGYKFRCVVSISKAHTEHVAEII